MPNETLGLPITDRFAKQLYEFFGETKNLQAETVQSLMDHFKNHDILSTVSAKSKTFDIERVPLATFFVPQLAAVSKKQPRCTTGNNLRHPQPANDGFVLNRQALLLHNLAIMVPFIVLVFLLLKTPVKHA